MRMTKTSENYSRTTPGEGSGFTAGWPSSLDPSPWRHILHPTPTQRSPTDLGADSPYPQTISHRFSDHWSLGPDCPRSGVRVPS